MIASAPSLALAAGLALAISVAAWRVHALTKSGAIAAVVVGFLVMGFGGGPGAGALLLFFISSSALSRWGKKRKQSLDYEKGGERDAAQVAANGGIAALAALLIPFFPQSPWPAAALLGALAAANADTWATEIGSLAARPPRLITTLRSAPVGSSGAVSVPGTLASVAGALLIAVPALFYGFGFSGLLAVIAGGVAGSLFDSLLGATVQVQYRCAVCGKITERHTHHDLPTRWERGLLWMNNDAVNLLATLCGALVTAWLSVRLLGDYNPPVEAYRLGFPSGTAPVQSLGPRSLTRPVSFPKGTQADRLPPEDCNPREILTTRR